MDTLFFVAGGVAIFSSLMVVTRSNAVHALLYLVVSLLSAGLIFFAFGAPFAAALEVIVYAGAIMVLFLFVIMMVDFGGTPVKKIDRLRLWRGPSILSLILMAELVYVLFSGQTGEGPVRVIVGPAQVGQSLFGPYALGTELASMLLLAGLVGAVHLVRRVHDGPDGEEGDRP
jgi:NADH-quinone oxidoreductase subunit J